MSLQLFKSSAIVSGMTMISRLLGYLRDVVVATIFGATGATDAFFVALRLPNLLRRMFAEGAFSQAFVPVFTQVKEERDLTALKDLVAHTSGALLVILGFITLIGVCISPWLVFVFAPGFSDDAGQRLLAADLLKLTFPYALFISLTAMAGGVLNSLGKFAIPALTPALLNISLISCALFLAPQLDEPVTALAWAVFIAGIAQLLFQFPALYKAGLLCLPRFSLMHKGVHQIARLMLPALFGSMMAQISILANTIIASFLAVGSISWLYYSDRFVELPLAIFGIAISTVILPRLSRHFTAGSSANFSKTMDWALTLGCLIAVPATIGLIALATPILIGLLEYRSFTATDTQMAGLSLAAYACGLPAFIGIKLLAPGFFARQDTKTPVKIGLIAIGVNLLLNIILVPTWLHLDLPAPHAVLASTTAFSAYINAILLWLSLRKSNYYASNTNWAPHVLKVCVASLVMAVVLYFSIPDAATWRTWSLVMRFGVLIGLVALGSVVYVAGLFALRVKLRTLIQLKI